MKRSRSREGAWIEIAPITLRADNVPVAPARERGLKLPRLMKNLSWAQCRSREGAWIEITVT